MVYSTENLIKEVNTEHYTFYEIVNQQGNIQMMLNNINIKHHLLPKVMDLLCDKLVENEEKIQTILTTNETNS